MKLLLVLFAKALLIASASAQAPTSDARPPQDKSLLEAYVDGVVMAHMRAGTPGVTVSVVKDGELLFAKGYGLADIEADRAVAGDDTLFRIGSISKTFIWTAVMMLRERGQLDLDADVNHYLAGVEIPPAFEAPVTLNHLMAHRAGFEDSLAVFMHRDGEGMSVTDALNRDMPDRVYAPGTRTSYSNWGSTLASKIVADVAGVSYEQFLADELLKPLDMAETTIKAPSLLPPGLVDKMAVGYEQKGGAPARAKTMEIGPHAPAGAIASTAADMARWMLLHLGGGRLGDTRILSEESHAKMWTREFSDRPETAGLAHGFFSRPFHGYDTFGHGGATKAFLSNMVLVPELGLGVFVSQNARGGRQLVDELPDLIIRRLAAGDRGPGETRTGDDLAHNAAECAGSYRDNRRTFTTFEKLFSLRSSSEIEVRPDGSLIVTSGGGSTRYEALTGATDTYQDRYGERIRFGRSEAGAITYYSASIRSFEKIGAMDRSSTVVVASALVLVLCITTWIGALWRRGVPATHSRTGRVLAVIDLLITGVVVTFFGAITWMTSEADASAADLIDYPPRSVEFFRVMASVLFYSSAAMVLSLWPAWRASGWSLWRKSHHTLFVLALAGLTLLLVRWNAVFAPLAI